MTGTTVRDVGGMTCDRGLVCCNSLQSIYTNHACDDVDEIAYFTVC